jgi:hypothetical protein
LPFAHQADDIKPGKRGRRRIRPAQRLREELHLDIGPQAGPVGHLLSDLLVVVQHRDMNQRKLLPAGGMAAPFL